VARSETLQANIEQHQEALAAKVKEQEKTQQASTYVPHVENTKHT
jgi:hypothetical protein